MDSRSTQILLRDGRQRHKEINISLLGSLGTLFPMDAELGTPGEIHSSRG